MIDLPAFLNYPRIERLYPFLERDYEEASQIVKLQKSVLNSGKQQLRDTFCNFEDYLTHKNLPEFYADKITYHCVERYNDYENRDEEIVEDIHHKIKLAETPPEVEFVPAADSDNEDKMEKEGGEDQYEGGKKARMHSLLNRMKCWKHIAFFKDDDHQCDDERKKTVEVEHSCIDFTILIIG